MRDLDPPQRRGDHAPQDKPLPPSGLRDTYAALLAVCNDDIPDPTPEDRELMRGGKVIGTPLDCDEDHFERGATLTEKISEEHEDAQRHRAHAEQMKHGRERADALRRARKADRRAAEFASRRVLARGPSRPSGQRRRMPRGDCARHGRARRATRSSAASGDSGGDGPGDPPPLARGGGGRLEKCFLCDNPNSLVVVPCLGCSDDSGGISPCGDDVVACTICWGEIHASLIGPDEYGYWS